MKRDVVEERVEEIDKIDEIDDPDRMKQKSCNCKNEPEPEPECKYKYEYECECENGMGTGRKMLAHAYVLWQRYDEAFSPPEALRKGTLFPNLYGVYPIPK